MENTVNWSEIFKPHPLYEFKLPVTENVFLAMIRSTSHPRHTGKKIQFGGKNVEFMDFYQIVNFINKIPYISNGNADAESLVNVSRWIMVAGIQTKTTDLDGFFFAVTELENLAKMTGVKGDIDNVFTGPTLLETLRQEQKIRIQINITAPDGSMDIVSIGMDLVTAKEDGEERVVIFTYVPGFDPVDEE